MSPPLATALAEVCGADAVRPGEPADQVNGAVPGWVAAPTTVEQVAGVLRAAHSADAAVCVAGAGTAIQLGTRPRALDVLLRTAALDRILEHSPGDLRVSAQAGVRLSTLQQRLAGDRQRLALDPPADGTLGGIIASNAAGPLRHRYGSPRDLLLGVTLVLADGTVARAGGKVVKNVAGYDLCKLVTGSYGTLAVIVEATVRLHHIPAAQVWLRHPVHGGDGLRALLVGYAQLRVEPSALELDVDLGTGAGTLDALLEGTTDGVADRVARVRAALGGEESPPPVAAPGPGTGHLVLQVVVAPDGVAGVVDGLRADPGPARHARLTGRAGVGVLHLAVPFVPAVADAGVLTAVRRLAARYDGTATVLHAPAGAELDVWGPVRGLALMRRVKEQFDPGQRLAPGRFVGGI